MLTQTLDPNGSGTELSRVVLKDLGLTSHILRIANSAMYNHSGRPILSIRHALALLGWETIRNLVGAVRYIEHFAPRSPGVRELVLLSALTASHGRNVADAVGYERPDEAYLCGLFRNLGEVLVACYQPEEYSEILVTMHEERISSRAASLRVLDFSWDDLGERVAEAWNMPSKVLRCLQGQEDTGSPEERSLVSIANYGHNLTQSLYRSGARFEEVHLRSVVNAAGHPMLVSVRDLRKIVDVTAMETKATFESLRIPIDELRMEHQLKQARRTLEVTGIRESARSRDALEAVLMDAKRKLFGEEFELNTLVQKVLEAVLAAGFERVIFGFVTEDSSMIQGRLGVGAEVDQLLERFVYSTSTFSLEDRFDESTLLLPVVVERKLAGCLYAERSRVGRGLGDLRSGCCRARDVIGTAIRRRVQTLRRN